MASGAPATSSPTSTATACSADRTWSSTAPSPPPPPPRSSPPVGSPRSPICVALAEAAAAGTNLEGAIVGMALHTLRFTLPDALEAVERVGDPDQAAARSRASKQDGPG